MRRNYTHYFEKLNGSFNKERMSTVCMYNMQHEKVPQKFQNKMR